MMSPGNPMTLPRNSKTETPCGKLPAPRPLILSSGPELLADGRPKPGTKLELPADNPMKEARNPTVVAPSTMMPRDRGETTACSGALTARDPE
jgi:hypothetical protein